MKIRVFFYAIAIILVPGIIGCGDSDKDLKKDTKEIAEIMCKSIDAMHKLRIADPADSQRIQKLQSDEENIQVEMKALYKQFNTKYGDKIKKPEFVKKFRKYLSISMLDCKCI